MESLTVSLAAVANVNVDVAVVCKSILNLSERELNGIRGWRFR